MLITGSGYGCVVALRVAAESETADAIRAALPFWWIPTDAAAEHVVDVVTVARTVPAIREIELWVAEHARERVFVHAAAVALSGRALLLPGRSMAGKTTLTRALLAAGADYLSDEYAVLDAAGLVHPYPRALSIRTEDGRRAVPAGELHARTVGEALPVSAVAVLRYEPGAAWAVRPLASAPTVLHLLDNIVGVRRSAEAALNAAVVTVRDAVAIEGVRGEATDVVGHLMGLLAGHGEM